MRSRPSRLGLAPGGIYNFDSQDVIKTIKWQEGAHNDTGGPELGHLLWEAALSAP